MKTKEDSSVNIEKMLEEICVAFSNIVKYSMSKLTEKELTEGVGK